MITDNEVIRLLELADPARVDDPAPVLEPAEYRDALLTGRSPVRLVDLVPTPSEPSTGRRWLILTAAAAAVVVAVALVAARDDVTPADQPSPTVTVPPTPLPRALPKTPAGRYVPGTYFVDEVSGTPTARIYFSVGGGWRAMSPGLEILQGDIGAFTFSRADRVFSDACHWSDGYYPGSVATLDGLVAALSEQQGWAEVTAPSDISIDGYAGKAFQRTAPADLSDCGTMQWNFSPWGEPGDGMVPVLRSWQHDAETRAVAGEFYEPGEVETLLVLDIDSTIVVINTRLWPSETTGARLTSAARALAGPTAAARADAAAVLDSIRIERP